MKKSISEQAQKLHEKAKKLARDYRRLERELLNCLAEVDQTRLYFELEYPSLFQYAVHALGLSEAVAYALINVARTMKKVPELRSEIQSGELSVFKAKKICSVLQSAAPSESREWIPRAKLLPSRALEREVTSAQLAAKTSTEAKPLHQQGELLASGRPSHQQRELLVFGRPSHQQGELLASAQETESPSQVARESHLKSLSNLAQSERSPAVKIIQLKLPPSELERFERCQKLVCQSRSRETSLEETLAALMDYFLKRKDPIEKAKRNSGQEAIRQKGTRPSEVRLSVKTPVSVKIPISVKAPISRNNELVTGLVVRPEQSGKSSRRRPIPSQILHAVNLRDQRKCQHRAADGRICGESRYVHIHHVIPVEKGGADTAENLVTLCSGHHQMLHWREKRIPTSTDAEHVEKR